MKKQKKEIPIWLDYGMPKLSKEQKKALENAINKIIGEKEKTE